MGSTLDFIWTKERLHFLGGGTFLGLVLLVLFFLSVSFRVAASEAQAKATKLRSEVQSIEATNQKLSEDNAKLAREIESLQQPTQLAKTARDDLGMLHQDEIVFFMAP